jgi:TonB family protein
MTRIVLLALSMFSGVMPAVAQAPPQPSPHSKHVAIYAPAPKIPGEARAKHLAGKGVFVLYVRPDGTVSHVETAMSTGQPSLDAASIEAFSHWRFRANSISKVTIPMTYTGNYTKPPKT